MSKRLPALTAKQLIRFLKEQGFIEDRQSGSHLTLKHPTKHRTVTIPVHTGTDIGKGLLRKILTDAGYSLDEFLRLR
jgi:predicted RNA binding protein YcfA (HicA-like mRNA interferase family)